MITAHIKKKGYTMPNTSIAVELGVTRQRIDQEVNVLVDMGKLVKLKPGLLVLPE